MLIGITGRKYAGKNTVADVLAEHFGLAVDAFARPIKDAGRDWFGLSAAQTDGELKEVLDERWGRTPREIMQLLGTEVGRLIHPDVWAKAAMLRHRRRMVRTEPPVFVRDTPGVPLGGWCGTVIADVRFPNEAAIIKANGGILIYVVRLGHEAGAFSRHASEAHVEAVGATADFEIRSESGVPTLQGHVRALIRRIEAER